MNPSEEWKLRVLASRAQQQPQQQIWSKMAAWYESWVLHNDYVDQTLPYILPFISPESRILEVGPGTGAFTIPLARCCAGLVAVEPAPGMRDALQSNLDRNLLSNVCIHPDCIENSLRLLSHMGPFDLTLASFALYNVEHILPVLEELVDHSSQLIILLGTGESTDWSRSLYEQFVNAPHAVPPQLDYLQPLLTETNLQYELQLLDCSNNYVFPDEGAMVDWWADRLRIKTEQYLHLQAALESLAEKRNGSIGIFSRRTIALVTIQGRYAKIPSSFMQEKRLPQLNCV